MSATILVAAPSDSRAVGIPTLMCKRRQSNVVYTRYRSNMERTLKSATLLLPATPDPIPVANNLGPATVYTCSLPVITSHEQMPAHVSWRLVSQWAIANVHSQWQLAHQWLALDKPSLDHRRQGILGSWSHALQIPLYFSTKAVKAASSVMVRRRTSPPRLTCKFPTVVVLNLSRIERTPSISGGDAAYEAFGRPRCVSVRGSGHIFARILHFDAKS